MSLPTARPDSRFPAILWVAALQGCVLYGLHESIDKHVWPATNPAWLCACYAVALAVPPTVQLSAEFLASRALWALVTALGFAFFYFGWHVGVHMMPAVVAGGLGASALPMAILWLVAMPFCHCRLSSGTWRAAYPALFRATWRNLLMLAESAVFTAIFWLLLELWAVLFATLGIEFFKHLFAKPVFAYPVTALAFGAALHLTGSIDRIVEAVRNQLLSLFKWLGPLIALIVVLFTLALAPKLPDLALHGTHAIEATWLLWLVAVSVLLLNAAFQDGSQDAPYPAVLSFAMRFVPPLLFVVAATAAYSIGIRIHDFGLTVERFWGSVVAVTAVLYASGYALSAFRRGRWLAGIGGVNIGVALGLMTLIVLALTPILSPERLAASSQSAKALAANDADRHAALEYLRWHDGNYGLAALEKLARGRGTAVDASIRAQATAQLAAVNEWNSRRNPIREIGRTVGDLPVYPQGRPIDADLRATLEQFLTNSPDWQAQTAAFDRANAFGVFVDFGRGHTEEFALVGPYQVWVFEKSEPGWRRVADGNLAPTPRQRHDILEALARGDFGARMPEWPNLRIGTTLISLRDSSAATPTDSNSNP